MGLRFTAKRETLVYLDAGQLFSLEKAIKSDPARLTAFIDEWGRLSACLVISLLHVQESLQGGDANNVTTFSELLNRFERVRFIPLMPFEIVGIETHVQLLSKICNGVLGEYDMRAVPQSLTLKDPKTILNKYRRFASFLRANYEYLADLQEITRQALKVQRQAMKSGRRHPDGTTVQEKMRAARADFLKASSLDNFDFVRRAPDGDLAIIAEFRDRAFEHPLVRSLIQSGVAWRIAFEELDFYEMAGTSLWLAVNRAQMEGSKEIKAGSIADASHIVYAPCVDLLFCDRNTFDCYTRQAMHRDYKDLLAPGSGNPLRRSSEPEKALLEVSKLRGTQ